MRQCSRSYCALVKLESFSARSEHNLANVDLAVLILLRVLILIRNILLLVFVLMLALLLLHFVLGFLDDSAFAKWPKFA